MIGFIILNGDDKMYDKKFKRYYKYGLYSCMFFILIIFIGTYFKYPNDSSMMILTMLIIFVGFMNGFITILSGMKNVD